MAFGHLAEILAAVWVTAGGAPAGPVPDFGMMTLARTLVGMLGPATVKVVFCALSAHAAEHAKLPLNPLAHAPLARRPFPTQPAPRQRPWR